MLSIKDLSFRYGKLDVLNGISFDVFKDETVCILGPSGSGKTTLLRLITGLESIQNGTIELSDISVEEKNLYKQHLGVVFQEPRLLPWRTSIENVLLPFELNEKKISDEQKEKAVEALKLVKLDDFKDSYPRELSGGMQHRLALARALVTDPDLLLLDEPLTGLDVNTKEELQDEIKKKKKETNKTVLWVTHDPQEAIYVADRIIILSERPTVIKEIVPVEYGYPRSRLSSDSISLEQHIRTIFNDKEDN